MAVTSLSQRHEALARANRARLGGRDIKAEITQGLSLQEALEDPRARSVKVGDLLCAIPKVGPRKATVLLHQLRRDDCMIISPDRRVRDLTERERRALARVADAEAARRAA